MSEAGRKHELRSGKTATIRDEAKNDWSVNLRWHRFIFVWHAGGARVQKSAFVENTGEF
jgi:hypothetical protein